MTDELPDRRAEDPWRKKMEREVAELREEMANNTAITAQVKASTDEVYDILTAAKGAFRVLGWIGVAAKWIGIIAGAVTAAWILWYQIRHGGDLPKK